MKSVNEIHDMIQIGRWNNDPASISHLLDIMLAMLDHIDTLNSRTVPASHASATQIERRKANRPNELVKRRSTDWPAEQPVRVVDYTKPHPFDLGSKSGMKHTSYRVCKCGLSEGNVLHPR